MTSSRPPLPDSYEGLLNRVQFALLNDDIDEAISLSRRLVDKLGRLSDRILDRRPDLAEMYLEVGVQLSELLAADGRYAEAYQVRNSLLEKRPDLGDDWRQGLAVLRIAKGKVEAGLADLQHLAESDPEDVERWLVLGSEARIEGRFAESETALERALEVSDQADFQALAEVHYQRFLLFRDMGRLDDAMVAWEQAVEHDSDWATTVREVYTMLTEAGRYTEARRYVDHDENPLQAGFQRGLIAQLTGDPDLAEQEWQSVSELDPEAYEAGQDCWAEAVLRLGDPELALTGLESWLDTFFSPRLLILSGIGWAMEDDVELASSLFQQAINVLRRTRPPKKKLDGADWRLLDSLVIDRDVKASLKPYFAVIETVWG